MPFEIYFSDLCSASFTKMMIAKLTNLSERLVRVADNSFTSSASETLPKVVVARDATIYVAELLAEIKDLCGDIQQTNKRKVNRSNKCVLS
jgi:hypothetical protein